MFRDVTTAGMIVIGNEVLSGKVEEQNARYAIERLREAGIDLMRIVTVRDDVETIAADVREMAGRYDHVFTSGGVGATHDDVTIEGVARGLGLGVERHAELEGLIRDHYGERVNAAALRMADAPEGATLLGVGELLYPVVTVRNIYIFPGVPQFFRSKFDYVWRRLSGTPVVMREVFVSVGESSIADALREAAEAMPDVEIGSYPRFDRADYRVRITVESRDKARVDQSVDRILERLDPAAVVRVR